MGHEACRAGIELGAGLAVLGRYFIDRWRHHEAFGSVSVLKQLSVRTRKGQTKENSND